MFFRAIVFFVFLIGCRKPDTAPEATPTPWSDPITWTECDNTLNQRACNIETYNMFNKPTDLYSFYGRPIVLDFAAAWCEPCMAAALEVQEVQDAYAANELVYITVLVQARDGSTPDENDLIAWAAAAGITSAPVWAGSSEIINLDDQTLGWFVVGWPTFYFIDEEMMIRGYRRGFTPETMKYDVELLLEESSE